jgi:anthranilate phosphoribosyltransferase
MVLRHLMRALGPGRKDSRHLTKDEAARAFDAILSGGSSPVLIASFLTSMSWKGVTAEELTGFAQAARHRATIPCAGVPGLVCVSPPQDGHDQAPPLDLAACLIAAAAGARVLLITDKGVPPRRGLTAGHALDSLGLSMTWDPTEAEDWIVKGRFAALSASGILPPLVGLREIRGEIGLRTPLSTVEKLLAPASAAVVLAAQSGPVLGAAAEVIQGLGHKRGIVVQGVDGGIVPSVRRRTRGLEITAGHLVPVIVEPEDFGMECEAEPELPMFGPPDEGRGTGDNPALVDASGDMTRAIFDGEFGSARNAALLGASLILKASGRSLTLAEGVDAAARAVDEGQVKALVEHLRQFGA